MQTSETETASATGAQRGGDDLESLPVDKASVFERDTVSIGMLLSGVWRARAYLSAGVILGGLLGSLAAFTMVPIYRAQVIAVPASFAGASGLSGSAGQIGELAAIAGLSLQRSDSTVENQEFLKSSTLTRRFIADKALLPVLYSDRWDQRSQSWRVQKPEDLPTLTEAVRRFNERIRSVTEDKRTNVVTLAITWRDRQEAAEWANDYLELANRELSHRAIAEAQSTLNYLNGELPRASSIGVQQALYHLIEDQQKIMALANTRTDFAFRIVDPAYVPERNEYVRPNRPLIILASAVLGALVGLAASRLARRRYGRRERTID